MLIARGLALAGLFLAATPVTAQVLVVHVSGTDGKSLEGELVEVQTWPGRKMLASGRTNTKGECILKLEETPERIYLIVRPNDKSVYAPFAMQYELVTLLKEKKIVMIRLRISRV
jgi:hypothetical protein